MRNSAEAVRRQREIRSEKPWLHFEPKTASNPDEQGEPDETNRAPQATTVCTADEQGEPDETNRAPQATTVCTADEQGEPDETNRAPQATTVCTADEQNEPDETNRAPASTASDHDVHGGRAGGSRGFAPQAPSRTSNGRRNMVCVCVSSAEGL